MKLKKAKFIKTKKSIKQDHELIWTSEYVSTPFKVQDKIFYYFNTGKLEQNRLMIKDCESCPERIIIDPNNFCKSLGIKKFKYIEAESSFDAKNAPIYCNTMCICMCTCTCSGIPVALHYVRSYCLVPTLYKVLCTCTMYEVYLYIIQVRCK